MNIRSNKKAKIDHGAREKFTILQACCQIEKAEISHGLFVVETLALKKTANERILSKIGEELDDKLLAERISSTKEDYSFTTEQLRTKLKWFNLTAAML